MSEPREITMKENARIDKAEKLESWDGPVELDGDYWGCIEEFLEAWLENHEEGDERPDYLWACKTHPFSTRDGAQKLIERASEEFPEEMDCQIAGIEALEAAVAAFEEANKGLVTWSPMNKVVRIPWEVLEENL